MKDETKVTLSDSDGNVIFQGSGDDFHAAADRVVKDLDRASGAKIPMKETAEDKQVRDRVNSVAADHLLALIEPYERLEAEKKDIADAQKEIMQVAKATGYDPKILRKVIALRKRDKDDVAEEEAILDMYKAALGM